MASAAVDQQHCHHNDLHLESLPLVDLRLLSQSELVSLSGCSSSSSASLPHADTDLFTPKIDRSVFNESAGSRKQTFYRLRLGAPRNNFSPSKPSPAPARLDAEPLDEENVQVVSLLKSLFNIPSEIPSIDIQEGEDLVPVQIEYAGHFSLPSNENNRSETAGLQNIPVGLVTCTGIKRKRGRPRKDEKDNWSIQNAFMEIEKIKTPMICGGANEKVTTNANPGDVSSCSEIKRKRGRPPKNKNSNSTDGSQQRKIESQNECNKDAIMAKNLKEMEVVNVNGEAVDLVALGNANDIVSCSGTKRKRGRPRKDKKDNLSIQKAFTEIEEIKTPMICGSANEKVNTNANEGDVSSCSEIKRKRGRPPKNRNSNSTDGSKQRKVQGQNECNKDAIVAENLKEMEVVNVNGEAVDLVALRNADDFLREELQRRTQGLGTEAELLELLKRLDGEWGTKSEKKRIVDAGNFCNMLPKGWKLMLCVRRRASNAWLACRRYISPNGQQFESCKDVSSYLLSSFGLQDASKQNSVLNADGIDLGVKLMSENLPMTSVSAEHDKQSTLLTMASTEAMQKATTIKCHKCTMTFSQQDDFICHLLSSHQGAATGLGHGASTSKEVLGKDGKYECHFCNQLFEEWHHYNSHLGVHIENYIKNIEGSARVTTLQKGSQPSSVGVTYKGSKMQESIGLVLDSATEDVGVRINLTEEKRDGNSGPLAIHGKEKTFSCQKIEDKHFTSITRETEINYVDKAARDDPKSGGYNIRPGLADATNDVMKKGSSEGHVPSANEKRHDLTDDMRGTLTLVRSSESGLTSHLDNKARVINNNSNLVSTKTKDDREVIVGSQYRDKDPTICFASNDDIKKPSRQKEMEIGPLTLDVSEQIFGYYNNVNKGSRGTIGVSELEKVQGSSGLGQAIGSNDNGLEADIVAGAERQRAKGCIFVPNVNEQAFTCILKELRQDRGESSVPQPLYKQRGNLTDLNVGYFVDSTHTKPDAGIMTGTGQKSCPHLFSDIEQKFACKINVPGVGSGGVGSGSVHEPKQKKSSLEDLFGVSASEQTYVKNNSNITCTGTVQEGPGLEGFKNAKNNEIMIGFGNHACPSDDAMTEFIWKTDDENVLLADLSETSSQLLQPVHYSTFDVRANKVQGESELFNVNEKFNSTSGFQGLRPGCIEHMEYNFLTAQTSSNSQDSKVSSYDSQMALGFDSSIWFEKEALPLLPKVAGRNQVTSCCSWCGNEFHSEAFDGEADKGLGVHMCPNCTTRFSTNHNFF